MNDSLSNILALYDQEAPLEQAYTIPAAWYVDERIGRLERDQVFGSNWIAVGRTDQAALRGSSSPSIWPASRSSWSAGQIANCAPFTMSAATMLPLLPPRPAESPSICAARIMAGPMAWMVRSRARRSSRVFATSIVLTMGWCLSTLPSGRTLSLSIWRRRRRRSKIFWATCHSGLRLSLPQPFVLCPQELYAGL